MDLATLVTHNFWKEKTEFLLETDTYPYWVMFAVERGAFRFRIGNREEFAEAGDIVVCPPDTGFWRWTEGKPLTFHFVAFEADTESAGVEDWPIGKCTPVNQTRYMDNLMLLATVSNPAYKEHVLNDILYMLRYANEPLQRASEAPAPDADMQEAAQKLKAQAYEGVRMKDIAQSLGLSQVQFTRRFRAAFRIAPLEYVTTLRMHHACRLLADTTLKLDDIARRCGYENGFYFSRAFTAHTGINPSEYRKRHRV